ncbi:MAG: TrwC relaxase, partial [Actinobacteria bacterium]|nr:TrwC relaxase [Actinomycetota bacterium]
GLSRGRAANTAHVVTRAVAEDAPPGYVAEAIHRNPAAVLAGILETADSPKSALATATESAQDTANVRTPAELLADANELATAARTAHWLDALVDDGHLSTHQRAAIAAEDGTPTLARVLRRAELAGHDPHQVLVEAVTDRPLADARQVSNVIHHRIATGWALDPIGECYADWTPQVADPHWRRYLDTLAAAADARREELGELAAADSPQWAVEAFGPAPEDAIARADWIKEAGVVAGHRELTGHTDDATALGPPPKPGQVEAYASWRAAWRALGRPDADRDEVEMSDGQLRLRVRAYEREQAWAPRYVANELAGTIQAAEHHRATATLRTAEATATTDPDHRARLQREARESAALADTLQARIAELRTVEDLRGHWLAHTAGTRAAADRATDELSNRRAADERVEQPVTAEEWLAAHHEAMQAEDTHREITDETDLADVAEQPARELPAPEHAPDQHLVETGLADLRDIAAAEPAATDEDTVRVPTATETAYAIQRAQRALAEIEARRAADQARDAEQARAEQLARWHTDDQVADHTAQHADDRDTPALEPANGLP